MKPSVFMKLTKILIVILIIMAGFVTAVLFLWNLLMPAIFGLRTITYWQAAGLLGLCWILFRGPRVWMGDGMRWRHRMRARWERMTPEEREKFRAAMMARCSGRQTSAEGTKA